MNKSKFEIEKVQKHANYSFPKMSLVDEQIIEKEVLTNKIWVYDSDSEYNNVEVYISFLRKKINLLKSRVKISTVRGIGYKLEDKKW